MNISESNQHSSKIKNVILKAHEFIKLNLKQFAENEGCGICIWYKGEMVGHLEYNYLDWTKVNGKIKINHNIVHSDNAAVEQ